MTKTNYATDNFGGEYCAQATSTTLGNVRANYTGPSGDCLKSACNVSHIAVDELYTSNILGHYMTF